jgi:hypothetical protein
MASAIIAARLRGFLASIRNLLPSRRSRRSVAASLGQEVHMLREVVATVNADKRAKRSKEMVQEVFDQILTGLQRICEDIGELVEAEGRAAERSARFVRYLAVLAVAGIVLMSCVGAIAYDIGRGDLERAKRQAETEAVFLMMRSCAKEGAVDYRDDKGRTVRLSCYFPEGSTYEREPGKPPVLTYPIKPKPLDRGNKA